MRSIVRLTVVSLVLVLMTSASTARSETRGTRKPNASGKGQNTQHSDSASKPPATDPVGHLGNDVANNVINIPGDPDDHVRCYFTQKQLAELRPAPTVPRLTEADESGVLTSIIQAITNSDNSELSHDEKVLFVNLLIDKLEGQLVGKTPGEALASVMRILYEVKLDTGKEASGTDGSTKVPGDSQQPTASGKPATHSLMLMNNGGGNEGFVDQEKQKEKIAKTVNTVATKARVEINKIAAPTDIGCAFQILSWNQARLLFGRSVADDFIAVQITVRNVNTKEEFLVHNAMFSVDTDIHGGMGRFFESNDKFSVEAYNTAGEPLTPRGIAGNSLTAAGTLFSVLQPIVGLPNFSNAVAAITGGVIPGFKTISPDHQREQLLLIANSGFSASDTKTVVGKSSSSTFYTWFPSKPFLEGWWVQECARDVVSVNATRTDPENEKASPAPDSGVDKVRARYACKAVTGKEWKAVPYKQWPSIADSLFRDLSLAVVAGIHVQEDKKNKPSLTDIKCPSDARGSIDLSKANSDGTLQCTVTGENLDNVKKLRLENKANAVDPIRPEATLDAQDTTGNAMFKVSDLAAATGSAYNVYLVAKDGTEIAAATTSPLHLDPTATILTGDSNNGTIDLSKLPASFSVSGYHVDKLTKVCFTSGEPTDPSSVTATATPTGGSQATVDVQAISHVAAGTWKIYPADCASSPKSGSISVNISGSAPAPPAVEKPAPKSPLQARPKPKSPGAKPSAGSPK